MKREKRKQREAIEKIKMGVMNQEKLDAQNALYDAEKPNVKLQAKAIYVDDGEYVAKSPWRCWTISSVCGVEQQAPYHAKDFFSGSRLHGRSQERFQLVSSSCLHTWQPLHAWETVMWLLANLVSAVGRIAKLSDLHYLQNLHKQAFCCTKGPIVASCTAANFSAGVHLETCGFSKISKGNCLCRFRRAVINHLRRQQPEWQWHACKPQWELNLRYTKDAAFSGSLSLMWALHDLFC